MNSGTAWTIADGGAPGKRGRAAKIGFPIHPHMLRHGTGFKLAYDGTDTERFRIYLGHKSITDTVRYSSLILH